MVKIENNLYIENVFVSFMKKLMIEGKVLIGIKRVKKIKIEIISWLYVKESNLDFCNLFDFNNKLLKYN